MCGPAAFVIAQAGVQMTQTVLAAQSQDQRAKATWEAARDNMENEYNANQAKEQQQMAQTQQQITQAQKSGMTQASKVRVAAAGSGVSGASKTEQQADVGNAVSNFTETAHINLANKLAQDQLDAQGYQAKAKSIINENPAANPAAVGLSLAGDAVGAADKAYNVANPVGSGKVKGISPLQAFETQLDSAQGQ